MPLISNDMTAANLTLPPGAADDKIAPRPRNTELSPDDFIKLFLTQLTHQNPMHPTDSSAILQQMAEISQIKASADMQHTMKEVQQNVKQTLGNSQIFGASALIGKKVQVKCGVSPLVSGEGLSGSVLLPAAATSVKVTITDAAGKEVKKIDLGAAPSEGLMDFKWDGKGADGKELPAEVYHLAASATVQGKEIPIQTAGSFKVTSVGLNQKSGSVILNLDVLGGKYMSDIIKIM